nr:hypothetical protein Iba_chr14fCG11230 [Ipomoea batatas]
MDENKTELPEPQQLWPSKPLVTQADVKPQSGPSQEACQCKNEILTVLCCSGGAFARALASAVIGTGAASRGSMPPISYGRETMPPTPGIGPSDTLRPPG